MNVRLTVDRRDTFDEQLDTCVRAVLPTACVRFFSHIIHFSGRPYILEQN